jgi:predicted RNA-binding protein associated with RNAse of E/G family
MPQFVPHLGDGRILQVTPAPVVGFLPAGEWWTAWFSTGRQPLKVDICTPARRRPDGDLEFADLCLDVVVRTDERPAIVDQDEFAAAGYPPALAAAAEAAAADVLRRVLAGDEPFATEGPGRLRS